MAHVQELGEKAYLLSPQDLAAYDLIEPLVKLGVRCFKIEGRLKSAAVCGRHVANVSRRDRRGDRRAAVCDSPRQQQLDLQQSFSRGFSPGFLAGVDHQRLVEGRFPKSRGVRLGTVVQRAVDRIVIELAAEHARCAIESFRSSRAMASCSTKGIPSRMSKGAGFTRALRWAIGRVEIDVRPRAGEHGAHFADDDRLENRRSGAAPAD